MRPHPLSIATPLLLFGSIACGGTGTGDDVGDAAPVDAARDASSPDGGHTALQDGGEACEHRAGEYTPRIAMSSTDDWPACVSDIGTYVRVDPAGVSSIARVAAYEQILAPAWGEPPVRGLLFGVDRDPSADDFLMARTIYEGDQGLGSRVVRRADEHEPRPANADCRLGAVVESDPRYCVGPTQLAPIVREAFVAGITGEGSTPARVHAARIDAALTWFLFLSIHKESLTCTETARDCDSMWAKYSGGLESREGGIGISRQVLALDREAHDRIWDGLLAVRCWRDLDPAPVATMLELRERARGQLDRALDRGIALVVIDRLRAMQRATGDAQRAHFEWLRVLLGALPEHTVPSPDPGAADITVPAREALFDRALRARSAELAVLVAAEMAAESPAEVDVDAIVNEIEETFACP
ncbi:MAG: hypothetical protein M3Y87_10830 [Myxococcota bacterium]|nr:hypothetical protein [Myxococcota bacterium]